MSDRTPIPLREMRLVVHGLTMRLVEVVYDANFSDLTMIEAAPQLIIAFKVMLAFLRGKPFNTSALARHLGMDRATMHRVLKQLEARKILSRSGNDLQINLAKTSDPAVRKMRQMIIDAAAELSSIE